jgi:ABC-2 type transport system permease protein
MEGGAMKKTNRTVTAVLLIGVIMLCGVLIAGKILGRLRLDLTQYHLYSLSQGTRNILDTLNQDLRLKLYYSRTAALKGPEQIRYYNNYFTYVRELLQEYVDLSDGKLTLEVLDPRPFSDAEEEAIGYGIQRFQITEDENFFFGLAVSSELGKSEVITFFEPDRQDFVEYDISKVISRVTRREKTHVGVLSSLPISGDDMSPYMRQMMQMQGRQPQQAWHLIDHLREEYEVTSIAADADEVPADINFLLVVHPKHLSQQTLYAIDQYVMGGGKLMVFVDPFCLEDQPPAGANNPQVMMNYRASSDLNDLLENWGVRMEEDLIAADPNMAITAQLSRAAPPGPVPVFLQVDQETVNKDEIISGMLHDVKMLYAGSLVPVADKGTEVIPLITTTDAGGTWKPGSPFEMYMPNPQAMMQNISPQDDPVILACRITGTFHTAFPDGAPPKEEPAEDKDSPESPPEGEEAAETPEHLTESAEASVVVVADVDMISDRLAYQNVFFGVAQVGDNASFVLNTLDFLSGSRDLIAIRSRGGFKRPFDVVDRIETEAEEQTAAKVDETNAKIAEYRQRLQELGTSATDENVKLLENEAMQERNRIQQEIRHAERQLRELSSGKRERIESLGLILQTVNMVLAPAVVLIIAVFLSVRRIARARQYAQRRTQE